MSLGKDAVPRMSRAHVLSSITTVHWDILRGVNDIDPLFQRRAEDIEGRVFINSKAQQDEFDMFAPAIDSLPYSNDPIFILGHWRSGTTHLHYLLCQDPQFAYINREDCFRPYRLSRCELPVYPGGFRKRQVDNLPIEPWMPGEDEFAIATRSLCSPFIGFAFPRNAEYYDRYLTLEQVSVQELKAWREAIVWTVKKAALWNPGRRIILKSPPHTARVRLLQELFPKSQFIYITRNPQDLLRSLLELVQVLGPQNTLQEISQSETGQTCLRRYRILAHAIARDKKLLNFHNFIECSYDDLHKNPLDLLSNVYSQLGLSGFDEAAPLFNLYLNSQQSFVPRIHPPLSSTMMASLDEITAKLERKPGSAL